jgi:hypothetical protein|tara:strand:- start:16265 stop:16717 length:453 start_codon:yes stop_codon:yes gene_type:complete
MASLLTNAEKTTMNEAMDDLHDTFARDVQIIKEAKKTVTSPNSQFNSVYGTAGSSTSLVYETQSGTYKARVQYLRQDEEYFSDSQLDSQLKIKIPAGSVRLKVSGDAHDYLKDAKRIQLDDRRFTIFSDYTPHGLFDSRYYTYYLKPIDE